ncbi:MAG: HAD family hydrolase [Planctomycetota bacterium]
MASERLDFDAVIFDLDGTLVATDRFWPDAAREGALIAFAELGLTREMPSSEAWMSLVGLPLEQGFDVLFADLETQQRAHVMRRCEEQEHRLLREGRAGLLPGVLPALQALASAGIAMGIASNCSQAYLDAMLQGAGLAQFMQGARCLHSPGIRNKADMVEELLIEFRSRRALMVGDRLGDRDAAWANGLAHVHLTRGYAQDGERVVCEAILPGMDGLLPLLRGRGEGIERILEGLCLGAAGGVCALLGPAAAGKAWLAHDLARRVEAQGIAARVLDGGDYLEADGNGGALVRWNDLLQELSDPGPGWTLLHGAGLWHARLFPAVDRLAWVEAPLEVLERRVRGGEPLPAALAGDLDRARALWQADLAAEASAPAAVVAHLRVDLANSLAPVPQNGGKSPAGR